MQLERNHLAEVVKCVEGTSLFISQVVRLVLGVSGGRDGGKLEHHDGVFCEGLSVYIEKSVLVLLETEPSGILGQQEDVICLSSYLKSYLWKVPRREERRDIRVKS